MSTADDVPGPVPKGLALAGMGAMLVGRFVAARNAAADADVDTPAEQALDDGGEVINA